MTEWQYVSYLDKYTIWRNTTFSTLKEHKPWIVHTLLVLTIGLAASYLAVAVNTSVRESIPLLVLAGFTVVLVSFNLLNDSFNDDIVDWYNRKVKYRLERFWKIGHW